MQQIVFLCALLDRALDCEPHRKEADAVPAVGWIEPRLVEIEGLPVPEAVESGCGFPVERQDEQPEPATLERQLGHLLVEGEKRGRVQSVGAATLAREAAEQVRKDLQRKAQEESDRIIEAARTEIQAEWERARRELRQEVGILAVRVAERVVEAELDEDRQLALVDSYIDELASSGGTSR